MNKDGQALPRTQVEDVLERSMVEVGRLAVGEGREVIVAAHELADATPEVGVVAQELANVLDRETIAAVDAATEGEKPIANLLGLRKQRLGQDEVNT